MRISTICAMVLASTALYVPTWAQANTITLGEGARSWDDPSGWTNSGTENVIFIVPNATQFTFNRAAAVAANQITFGGIGVLSLSATDPFPTITTLDLSGMTSTSTINFNTGATNVIVGKNTTLSSVGTGTLTVGDSKTATLHNILWDEAKITRSGTGLIAYTADDDATALTALPLASVDNANVLIKRPIVTLGDLLFSKPCTYEFQNTTAEMLKLRFMNTAELTLDSTTLSILGSGDLDEYHGASIMLGDTAEVAMTMQNESKLVAHQAVISLGWNNKTTFTVTNSELDVAGVRSLNNNWYWYGRSFTLDNSILKFRSRGLKTPLNNTTATFKNGTKIYALASAPIEWASPIQLEGAVTFAASADQTLTISSALANVNDATPASITFGATDYTGTVKLNTASRPSIAGVESPLIIVPTFDEISAGRVVFPTTLEEKPVSPITLDGYITAPTVVIEGEVGAKQLVIQIAQIPDKNISLTGGTVPWDSTINSDASVNFTLTNNTTLTLNNPTSIKVLTVKSSPAGTSFTLTLEGDVALSCTRLEIREGAKVKTSGTTTLVPNAEHPIIFNNGTLIVNQTTTFANPITVEADGGTIDVVTADATCTLSGVITGAGLLTKSGLGTVVISTATTPTAGMTFNSGKTIFGKDGGLDQKDLYPQGEFVVNAGAEFYIGCRDMYFEKATIKINAGTFTNNNYNHFGAIELTGGTLDTAGSIDPGWQSTVFTGPITVKGEDPSSITVRTGVTYPQAAILANIEINVEHADGRLIVSQEIIQHERNTPSGVTYTLTKAGLGTWEQNAMVTVPVVSINAGTLTGTDKGSFTGAGGVTFANGVTLGGALKITNATFGNELTLDVDHGVPTIGTLTPPVAGVTTINLKGTPSTTANLLNWDVKPEYAGLITCTNAPAGYKLVASDTGLALAKAFELDGTATWDGSSITVGGVTTPITATDTVVITLTTPTTLTLSGEIPLVRKLIVKSPGATSHTLTLEGGTLTWSRLEICEGAIVALSATTTIGLAAENVITFDRGTLVMGKDTILGNAIIINVGDGTINTNGHACGTTGQVTTGVGTLTRMGTGDFVMTNAVGVTGSPAASTVGMTFSEGRTVFGTPTGVFDKDPGTINYGHRYEYGTFTINSGAELYLGCVDISFKYATVQINGGVLTNTCYNRFGTLELTGGTFKTIGGAYPNTHQSTVFKGPIIAKGETTSNIITEHVDPYNNYVQATLLGNVEINVEDPKGRLVVDQDIIKHQGAEHSNTYTLTKTGLGTWEQNAAVTIPFAIPVNAGTLTGTGTFTEGYNPNGNITGGGSVIFADAVTLGGTLKIANATFGNTLTLDVTSGAPTITTLTLPETGTAITLKGTPSTTTNLLNWTTKPTSADLITSTEGYTFIATDTGLAIVPPPARVYTSTFTAGATTADGYGYITDTGTRTIDKANPAIFTPGKSDLIYAVDFSVKAGVTGYRGTSGGSISNVAGFNENAAIWGDLVGTKTENHGVSFNGKGGASSSEQHNYLMPIVASRTYRAIIARQGAMISYMLYSKDTKRIVGQLDVPIGIDAFIDNLTLGCYPKHDGTQDLNIGSCWLTGDGPIQGAVAYTTDYATNLATVKDLRIGLNGEAFPTLAGVEAPQSYDWWTERLARQTAKMTEGYPLVCIGDSITQYWEERQLNLPNYPVDDGIDEQYQYLGKYLNLGMGGDTTGNVLYRLKQITPAQWATINPSYIALLIGTNNCHAGHAADDIASAIHTIVNELKLRCPTAEIALYALFPRSDITPTTPIADVNALLKTTYADTVVPYVTYVDLGEMLAPNGTPNASLYCDGVHLSGAGYDVWGSSIQSTLSYTMPPSVTFDDVASLTPNVSRYIRNFAVQSNTSITSMSTSDATKAYAFTLTPSVAAGVATTGCSFKLTDFVLNANASAANVTVTVTPRAGSGETPKLALDASIRAIASNAIDSGYTSAGDDTKIIKTLTNGSATIDAVPVESGRTFFKAQVILAP